MNQGPRYEISLSDLSRRKVPMLPRDCLGLLAWPVAVVWLGDKDTRDSPFCKVHAKPSREHGNSATMGTPGVSLWACRMLYGHMGHDHECYGVMLSPVGASWPLWALWGATVQVLSLAPWEATAVLWGAAVGTHWVLRRCAGVPHCGCCGVI